VSSQTWPVSVKGVVIIDGGVVLLHNERDEWELPGGRLEVDESPEECVARELLEETGLEVVAGELLDAWIYPVLADRRVLVLTYACTATGGRRLRLSDEHDGIAVVELERIDEVVMPDGYKASIERWRSWERRART
jgi:8-oxo-dGTP pyrophosphatase MutT (NUDIX family)